MRQPISLTVAVLAGLLGTVGVLADVRVVKHTGESIGVSVAGVTATGPAAQLVQRTLVNNLGRSGWMKIAEPGHVQVRGSITESAGQVQFACVVTDMAGRTYLSGTYSQPVGHAVYLAHQVAHDIVARVADKPTFFMARLVLIRADRGTKELYIGDSSLQDVRQLTADRSISLKPRFSPDNRFIAYTSYQSGYPDVYTIEVATGQRTRVSAYPGMNTGGAISPDGRSMALILSKDGNPDLYVKDLASGRLTRLTNTPRAVESSPVWSPDGSQIAYVSDAPGTPQIYVISRMGDSPRALTRRGSQNVSPDWGSNGLLAYQTVLGGRSQIAVLDPSTGQSRTISPPDASYEDPSWAPDGRHLVATRIQNYRSSIYLLDSMSNNLVALTTSGEWTAPAWSR